MSKYWGKQIFRFGSFPEVGQKQKTGAGGARKAAWAKTHLNFTLSRILLPVHDDDMLGKICNHKFMHFLIYIQLFRKTF